MITLNNKKVNMAKNEHKKAGISPMIKIPKGGEDTDF